MSRQEFMKRALPVLKEMDNRLTLEQRRNISNELVDWYMKNKKQMKATTFRKILRKNGYKD